MTVADFSISADGKWIGFRGISANRYERNITEQNISSNPYLLEVATGQIERLVNNTDVAESALTFSPDGRFVAMSAPGDLEKYSMTNQRVYVRAVGDRGGKWRKLGESFDGDIAIGFWSKDEKMVGGVLIKPVGYQPGQRYPLIVAIHGGPASADVLSFNGGYGSQVYAGAGYVVLRPNYRGSTNYGEAHRNGIVGNYFPPGFDDIMTGVDALIAQGIVDGTRMGALGWSAGGHWSNWILTHTDRFKAISSGAGTSNWISMYAQSDMQRNRQFYLGNKLPYDDFDAYWIQSPLKYIKAAKTPMMIHVVQGDPRVPSPQSIELHMALKRLGVPTELFIYPGESHGIPDPRNQFVKSMAEMAWMDYYVRGMGKKFAWRSVLDTLEEPGTDSKKAAEGKSPEER